MRYSDLQKTNRFLKNEITGSVALGSVGDELYTLNLTGDGNLVLAYEENAKKRIAFGKEVIAGVTETVYNEISTETFSIKQLLFTGNGLGEITVRVNGSIWFTYRNSYFNPSIKVDVGKVLAIGDGLSVSFRNTSFIGQTNVYECYLLGN